MLVSGTECYCTLGLVDGGPCGNCTFGEIQAEAIQAERLSRLGHGPALDLSVIPFRYRENTIQTVAALFGADASKLTALLWVGDWTAEPWAEQKFKSLYLYGPVGTGKTTLSMLALAGFLRNGHRGQVIYYTEWINHLGALSYQAQAAAVRDALTVPVLVIDDLGSQDRYDSRTAAVAVETSFRVDTVRLLINGRMNKGVPTIITSNLSPEMIGVQFGARVQSRMAEDFKTFAVNGEDIRLGGVNRE